MMRSQRLQVGKMLGLTVHLSVKCCSANRLFFFLSHLFLQDCLVRVMGKDLMHFQWKHLIRRTVAETPLWTTSPRKGSYLKSAVMTDFRFAVKVLRVSEI